MSWLKRKVRQNGSVLFRGTLPPRAEDFAYLASAGVAVKPMEARPNTHWALRLHHPEWGTAFVASFRGAKPPGGVLIEHSVDLTPADAEMLHAAGSVVSLASEGAGQNVLRERKHMLRFLRLLMGDDGLAAVDHLSQRFWTRASLAEELAHDADLDVVSLYSLHLVHPDSGGAEDLWLHSHGLAEAGGFDFDVMRPTRDLAGHAQDILRAIAFAIVEGLVTRSVPNFQLAFPNGSVRFVDAQEFNRRAPAEDAALRDGDDPEHNTNRVVVCDPVRGLFARWSKRVCAAKFLSRPIQEGTIYNFSHTATELMEARARCTYARMRALAEEFAKFEFPLLAKIAYEIDGGGPDDCEHLWFTVQAFHDDHLEATLANEPHHISRMKAGDRGTHALERMTDWAIMTPAGIITPRDEVPARRLRELVAKSGQACA